MLANRKRLLLLVALLVGCMVTLVFLLRRSRIVDPMIDPTAVEIAQGHAEEAIAKPVLRPPVLGANSAPPVPTPEIEQDHESRPAHPISNDSTARGDAPASPDDPILMAGEVKTPTVGSERRVRSIVSKGSCTIGIKRLVVDEFPVALPATNVELQASQQIVFDDPISRRVVDDRRRRVFRGEAQRTVKVKGTSSTRDGAPLSLQETSTTYALPVRYLSIPLLPYSCGYGDRAQCRDDLTDEDLVRFKLTRAESEYRVNAAMNGFGDIDCLAYALAASRTGSGAVLRSRALLWLLSPLGSVSAEVDSSLSVESRMFASTCPGMSTGFFFWQLSDSDVELTLAYPIAQPAKTPLEGIVDLRLDPPEVHFVQNYLHGLGLMREWAPAEYRDNIRVETTPNAQSRLHADVRLVLDPVETVLQEASLIARYEFHLRVMFDTNDKGRDEFDSNRGGPTRHVEVDLDLVGNFTTTLEQGREHLTSAIEGAGIHKGTFFR